MSVKHSWAGSRLIHACRCVGQALEGPHRGPTTVLHTRSTDPIYVLRRRTLTSPRPFYHHETGVRELVAGDNSLFVAGFAGTEICSGYSSRSSRRGLFIMRIERAEGDKDPVRSFSPIHPLYLIPQPLTQHPPSNAVPPWHPTIFKILFYLLPSLLFISRFVIIFDYPACLNNRNNGIKFQWLGYSVGFQSVASRFSVIPNAIDFQTMVIK